MRDADNDEGGGAYLVSTRSQHHVTMIAAIEVPI